MKTRALITPVLAVLLLFPGLLHGAGKVRTGLEILEESGFALLKGKRVGLITNPTGIDRALRSTVDLFHSSTAFDLVALFGPEHGVRGDYGAGDYVENYTDPHTGLPVYSIRRSGREAPSATGGLAPRR